MSKRLSQKEVIQRFKEKHGNTYSYSEMRYEGMHSKVEIICPIHGSFWQTPHDHLKGQGCPRCFGKEKLTQEEFIKRANKAHKGRYDYLKANYINNHTNVIITCPKHGDFEQMPQHHLRGNGCPSCAIENRSKKSRKSLSEFVEQANKVHNGFYDYSETVYVNSATKVKIICPEHGVFEQTPNDHLSKKGCPKCGITEAAKSRSKGTDQFIKDANKTHHDYYDYSKVEYLNTHTPVCIVCPEHGEFSQRPSDHLSGKGCPKCAHVESSYENNLYEQLIRRFDKDDIETEHNNDYRYPFRCDFYIKSVDLFVECNGFWTHGFHWYDETNEEDSEKLKLWKSKNTKFYDNAIETWTKRDVLKRQTARKNNLNYVVLWTENDIKDWFSLDCPVRQDWK